MVDQEIFYPLTSLYLYLTDRCNLSCSHCWISPEFSQLQQNGIPLDSLKKTISEAEALGLGSVKLTGGEPLLYRQLDELLTFLKSKELTIYIETNGTLIDQKMIKSFQAAGVEQIAVSLDAATEEIHNKIRGIKGSYARTLQGLHRLSDSGLQCQIIMTLQRKNLNEIPGMIQLSQEVGAASLKINHMLPCGRGKEAFDKKENLELEELTRLYQMVEKEWLRPDALEVDFDLPAALRSIEHIKRRGLNACRILNILGILANGDFSICGIGQTVEALRMGNLMYDSIGSVWKNNPILNELRQSLTSKLEGACGGCIFKFQCLGGCRANAYFLTENLHAPYFLCQQYYEAGLFPSSRHIE
jgi:SynChlorMet cassette radical SAM/SPASM protein ScmF